MGLLLNILIALSKKAYIISGRFIQEIINAWIFIIHNIDTSVVDDLCISSLILLLIKG